MRVINRPVNIPDVVICPYCHYWDAAWDRTKFGTESIAEMQEPRDYKCPRCLKDFKAVMTDAAPYFDSWRVNDG